MEFRNHMLPLLYAERPFLLQIAERIGDPQEVLIRTMDDYSFSKWGLIGQFTRVDGLGEQLEAVFFTEDGYIVPPVHTIGIPKKTSSDQHLPPAAQRQMLTIEKALRDNPLRNTVRFIAIFGTRLVMVDEDSPIIECTCLLIFKVPKGKRVDDYILEGAKQETQQRDVLIRRASHMLEALGS